MSSCFRVLFIFSLVLAIAAAPAEAHVGSPDIFFEGTAGPYRLLVTVRPPRVVPGVAEIQVRSADPDVGEIRFLPLPIGDPEAQHAPTPDVAVRSKEDPQLFTGSLWLMMAGSWQVRVLADGARGKGELGVPVPALPERTLGMERALAAALFALLVLLAAGLVAIVGASVREGGLEPGREPGAIERRRARRYAIGAAAVVLGALYLGNLWWESEATAYAHYVYQPIRATASIEAGGEPRLALELTHPAWMVAIDDLVPDHGHLMHLFAVRLPDMGRILHLHPERKGPGQFVHPLPPGPAGRYQLFADIVHAKGLAETAVASLDLPAIVARSATATATAAGDPDDSIGEGPPIAAADPERVTATLSDGARVTWERPAGSPLRAKEVNWLRFRVDGPSGAPADDLELYMGMQGHLAIVSRARDVFAHIHPSGSVSMASLAALPGAPATPHAACAPQEARLPPIVGFPYGFPRAGEFRLFLQIKRRGRVETAIFDAHVVE